MRKTVLLLFVVLATASVYAQKTIGAKMGLNIARTSEKSADPVTISDRVGFVGGFYMNYKITDKLSIQPELIYSSQGENLLPLLEKQQ